MKIIMTVKEEGSSTTWQETAELDEIFPTAQSIIDSFNTQLKEGEKRRELVSWKETFDVLRFSEDGIDYLSEMHAPLEWRKEAVPGDMYVEGLCVWIAVRPGQQDKLKELPGTEAEDCHMCDEEASEMVWKDGAWHCPSCGSAQ